MNIARVIGKMQTAVRHLASLRVYGLLLAVAYFSLFTSCSDDLEAEQGVSVTLTNYVTAYTDYIYNNRCREEGFFNDESRTTRSWTIPTGYQAPSSDVTSLGVYFTNNTGASNLRRFWYAGGKWRIEGEAIDPGTYQLYGFLPYTAATANIEMNAAPNNSYAKGAVLTLNGLSGIMTKDMCVLVGAKEGTDADTPTERPTGVGLQTGMFDCELKAGGTDNENYLFLLFDHLYAQLKFNFTINNKYAKLRTIKLKRLELMAYTENTYTTKMKKEQSTTVTLLSNTDGSNPIVSVSNLTANASSGDMDPVILFNDEITPMVLDSVEVKTYSTYVPEVPSYYILRSVYDVYDNNKTVSPEGNLIRKNCEAENKLNPRAMFNQQKLNRGKIYTINMTVNPTYLYVLSEPDLDNPTITLD